MFIACLDAGHGNYDPGSIGKNGTKEKDINLIVTKKIAKYLQSNNIKVCFTRDSDKVSWPSNLSQDLAKRTQIANSFNPDVFVSIHCNSHSNANAKGFEIFTTPGQNNSDKLATKIHSKVKSTFPNLVYREDYSDGDPDKEAKFYVIKYSNCPSTLIELLFISNPDEEKMLNDPEFQDKMAFSIAQGIGDFLGVKIEKEINKKEVDNMLEKWKIDLGIDALNELTKEGIIKNPEQWENKLEDSCPNWLMFTLIQRLLDNLQK